VSGLRELVFLAPADAVERWSDALIEAGALSVQAEDADADAPGEQPLYGEPGIPAQAAGWTRTRLAALLAEDTEPRALLDAAAGLAGEPAPAFTVRAVPEQDWVRLSQAQFEPIPIGDRLTITPSWHLHEVAPGPGVIVLDPGLAFGTGSHPTTRLCLLWLCEHLRPGQTVIDYGCGSGILAIAAARLGAAQVTGVDIDPQALQATRANARINDVDVETRGTGEAPPAPADIVVANILASPLKVLAPMLTALMRPGGALVLAGLLDRQADEVAAAYAEVDLSVAGSLEGWACLAGRKR
jgi:ribosomal protein L11 methyltransferase